MVRASKSATPATTPVPKVEASASAPVVKAPRTKKVAAAPVADTTSQVAAAQPASEVAVADASLSGLPVKMTEYSAKLQQLVGLLSTLKNDFKTLEKTVAREMKAAQKASSKKRRNNVNRKPSGFVKPTRISDELAAFLGKTVGTEMARTDVSKELNAYIQTNKLQDAANGRKINPDAKLAKLLKISADDELTYFNLQRFMKHHFIKAEVPVVATA
uniref:DM2 domain-containing protein n=1 Tax=viral metagenome TaxID=1070528 RepID=A0A6C0L8J4_9ZZZZ